MTSKMTKSKLAMHAAALPLMLLVSTAQAQTTLTSIDDDTASDSAGIENTVTVTGSYDGTDYENTAFENVDVETANPNLTVTKTADITSGAAVGDEITYTYLVANTGNVILDDVSFSDSHRRANASGGTETETLAVGNCFVSTDTYFDDSASASATVEYDDTGTITSGTAPVASDLNGGDTTFTASNDGITDFGPGDIVTCTAAYTVTQYDICLLYTSDAADD